MRIIKLIFIGIYVIFSFDTPAKEQIKTELEIVLVVLGKCKLLSQKKVIEISSQNKSVLSIEKDLLSNKICLKGKKLGSSKVSMLLFDGSGKVSWLVRVVQPTQKGKKKRTVFQSKNKVSKFDKDLEISHKLSGWK